MEKLPICQKQNIIKVEQIPPQKTLSVLSSFLNLRIVQNCIRKNITEKQVSKLVPLIHVYMISFVFKIHIQRYFATDWKYCPCQQCCLQAVWLLFVELCYFVWVFGGTDLGWIFCGFFYILYCMQHLVTCMFFPSNSSVTHHVMKYLT